MVKIRTNFFRQFPVRISFDKCEANDALPKDAFHRTVDALMSKTGDAFLIGEWAKMRDLVFLVFPTGKTVASICLEIAQSLNDAR